MLVEEIEQAYPACVLETLLSDRTTNKNIIWADNEYEALGTGYLGKDEITVASITGTNSGVIKPRVAKEQERQSFRTKSRAEVFTPSWLCNQMNNYMDEEWFGRPNVFNIQKENRWTATTDRIVFPDKEGLGWQNYVDAQRLEITCGEAPFICSRYDTVDGTVLPLRQRIGFLDRKLRVVTENTETDADWLTWAFRALESTYGYEYQGDNLIIARINVLETFAEYLRERLDREPSEEEINRAAHIVSWNIWQMDGLNGTVPSDKPIDEERARLFALPEDAPKQASLFDFDDFMVDEEPEEKALFCHIYDWREDKAQTYVSLKRGR